MKRDCDNCKYSEVMNYDEPCYSCNPATNWEPKVLTNADRIRAMTDEELATNFASRCCPIKDEFYKCGEINKKEFSWEDCESCWLDWLKSPVEVDNGT